MKFSVRDFIHSQNKYFKIFHPYLFGVYPVAAAIARNLEEIKITEAFRPLLVGLLLAIILFIVLSKFIKPIDRAALLTSLILMYLLEYGYYYRLPKTIAFLGININRHLIIGFIWIIIIVIVTCKRLWKYVRPNVVTKYMNIMSIISFFFVLRVVVLFEYSYIKDPLRSWKPNMAPITTKSVNIESISKPDIYYIVLDGYGRQDVFEELYDYDNTSFINELSNLGFFIATESRSNYVQTDLSLASSLNLEYLDDLDFTSTTSKIREPLKISIRANRLSKFLRTQGYTIVTYDSGIFYSKESDSDIFFTPESQKITNFEAMMFDTSAFRLAHDFFGWSFNIPDYDLHRARIQFSLSKLSEQANNNSPKFVFVHILAPHPPFVFDSSGNPITPDMPYMLWDTPSYLETPEYRGFYKNELTYLNQLVIEATKGILANSNRKPIIIIQGDHGPGSSLNWQSIELTCVKERISILNVFYPSSMSSLYPTITPVNSFRIILDNYFNTSLGILPDIEYFSPWERPYDFTDVTNLEKDNCD